jgi:hypothetical protein
LKQQLRLLAAQADRLARRWLDDTTATPRLLLEHSACPNINRFQYKAVPVVQSGVSCTCAPVKVQHPARYPYPARRSGKRRI